MKALFAALAPVCLLAGCQSYADPPAPIRPAALQQADAAALELAGERWKQLYEAGDWVAIRQLYANDAVLMTNGQPKLVGPDAIVGFLRRLSDMGAKVTFRFDNEEILVDRPYGFVTAKYRMDIAFPGRDPATAAGRSYLVYKLEDGAWKLWRDIDNLAPDATAADFE